MKSSTVEGLLDDEPQETRQALGVGKLSARQQLGKFLTNHRRRRCAANGAVPAIWRDIPHGRALSIGKREVAHGVVPEGFELEPDITRRVPAVIRIFRQPGRTGEWKLTAKKQ